MEERKRGRKGAEPIPPERLRQLRMKLWDYSLNYGWLVQELHRIGVETCKEDLSMYLRGTRKGAKATAVVDAAFAVLEKYEQMYCGA